MVNEMIRVNGMSEGNATQTLVVSQTGGGDFKSIARAIEHASPGAVIMVKSGFYEESLHISKPLTLIGDEGGLTIVTNSNLAVLSILSAEVKLVNMVLVSGMRSPSIDMQSAELEFNNSILWALDTFLKQVNPSLIPARALVGNSFLGACMRMAFPLAALISDLLRPAEGGPEDDSRETAESLPPPKHFPPDVVLTNGSRFSGNNSFIATARFAGCESSTVSFTDCRLDAAAVTSSEDSAVLLSGCDRFGEPWKPRIYIRRGHFADTNSQIHPTPDPVKRELEASLLLRVNSWAANANGKPPGVKPSTPHD